MPFAHALIVFLAGVLFVARAVEDGDGVWQQFRNGVERFHRAARTAGEIDDDRLAANAGNPT